MADMVHRNMNLIMVDDFDCLELYNRNQWSHSKNCLGRRPVEKYWQIKFFKVMPYITKRTGNS